MTSPWICRPYRPGDEAGLCELYREVFRLDLSLEYWRWAFQQSPDGAQVIAIIEQAGRIAGQYTVQPRKFWLQGKSSLAGYAGGTMLAPAVRNVKSFVAMAQLAYSMCREREITWLYCCPNAQALPVRRRLLDWGQLSDIVEWEGSLPKVTTPLADNVHMRNTMPALLSFDAFEADDGHRPIQSQRSKDWISWRFFDRPGGDYVLHTVAEGNRVTGYAITKRYNRAGMRMGHVIDWQLRSAVPSDAKALLASVWQQLAQWDVARVSCWADGDEAFMRLLQQDGLTPTGASSHLCYYDLAGDYEQALAQRDNWRIVMVDCDVY